jgi:hypothetical protein
MTTRFDLPSGNAPYDQPDSFPNLNFPNAIGDERQFYGRRLERERITHTLLTANGPPVFILGERRMGKTSLQTVTAKQVVQYDPERFVSLFLPPASAIRSWSDYAKEMLQALCSYLDKSLRETGLLDAEGRFRLNSLGQFTDAAARLLESAPNKTFIVCVDELDAILVNCAPDEATKIRGLTDHIIEGSGLPLAIYFSMTHPPHTLPNAHALLGISKAEVIELGPMPQEEAIAMVRGLLLDHAALQASAMDRLLQLSAGHPYFVKLLLDRLLTRYWRGAYLGISSAMLEDIIPDATQDPRVRHTLDNIYKVHFTSQEQQLVLLLAQRAAEVSDEELRTLGAEFVTAAKRLVRRGYLARTGTQNYDFRVRFLGWWLRHWEEFEEEGERLNLETLTQKLGVDIQIDQATKQVRLKGSLVKLTPSEYRALACLCQRAGQLVSRDQLADALWPEAQGDVTNTAMDALIYRLRRKLGDNARQPRYIKTVPEQGFILYRAAWVQTES